MIELLRPNQKPLFKWTKYGVVLLHPQQHINLELIEQDKALDILDNLLDNSTNKYYTKDIKEVINHILNK